MTRETKIGLLIGLGFIVVFAVLLSHTGSELPAGDGMQLVSRDPDVNRSLPERSLAPRAPSDGLGQVDRSARAPAAGSAPPGVKSAEDPRSPLADGLPTPDVFGDSSDEWTDAKAAWETTLTGRPSQAVADGAAKTVANRRVAPQLPVKTLRIEQPQPGARPDSPTVTPQPGSTVQPDAKPKKKAPPTRQATPKEYIVKKGDTVRKIIRTEYGRASTKIVAFLVSANKSRIKDKDTIIEGQKLTLPPLPPELFEPAPGFDASRLSGGVRTVTSAAELSGLTVPRQDKRVAPGLAHKRVKTDGRAAGKVADSGPKFRTYEVRKKDTLSSIAERELGSSALWREIKKLNRHIDPKKMQPGMKIKLPTKRSISGMLASKRESA
jgi:nucleoid-associated protein YgaU